MRIRVVALVVGVAVLSALVFSQAQAPYTTANRWQWEAPSNVPTASVAQSLVWRIALDGGTPAQLAAVSCAVGTPIVCTANLLPAQVATLNTLGGHAAVITSEDTASGGGLSQPSAPFSSRAAPGVSTIRGIQ